MRRLLAAILFCAAVEALAFFLRRHRRLFCVRGSR
jgi:hypothetical protein